MALSAAEKQRRYRERRDQDPERRAKFLNQQKERYQRDKELGKRKLVSDMTAREKRHQRRYWKEKQRMSRRRRQAETLAVAMTPPQTPENTEQPGPSRQFRQAKRKKMRENSKLYREKNILLLKLQAAERKAEMFRKRWERLRGAQKPDNLDTPRTKTRKLLRCYSAKVVKKTLDFHHVLVAQIRENCKQRSKRIAVDRIITGKIMKKYRLTECMRKEFGVNTKHNRIRKKKGSLSTRVQVQVRQFFERDDVSRITTGMKRTVTKNKAKKQKRLLNDTVQNLDKKFVAETNNKISFTTFWRLKPFWIKGPTQRERDTCICRTCDNIQMKASVLAKAKVIESSNMSKIVDSVVCSKESQACMYGHCQTCKQNTMQTQDHDEDQEIMWQEWKTIKEQRTIKKDKEEKVKGITITKKATTHGTIKKLKECFQTALKKFKEHQFNINNQYNHYRKTKQSLKENECFMHIDFSENYVGKLAKETSSMHYGASQPQITLHTGYYQVGTRSKHVPFATISDSLQHGPAAIWASLTPVLHQIRSKNPEVDSIHFYSDGPSTQYRQKNNFFLLSTEIFSFGFKRASWNFHEAGHGKGIPDGIGGTLKRAADRRVLYGADITNAYDFIAELKKSGTNIELFQIEEKDIQKFESKLKQQEIQTIPGTLKIHQMIVREFGEIEYRDVSCHCTDNTCEPHSLKQFSFNNNKTKTKNKLEEEVETVCKKSVLSDDENISPETVMHPRIINACIDEDIKHVPNIQIDGTEDVFSIYLGLLQQCKSFEDIQDQCKLFNLEPVNGKVRSIVDDKLCVDEKAMDLYPEDYESNNFPVTVKADGDCLPACGSVYLYGTDTNSEEVRVRIIAELSLNIDYYLNEHNLRKGFLHSSKEASIKKTFAMFSPDFIPGIALTDDIIRTILENEIKSICTPKTFMGIWQMFGLASVLQMPIFSVYPVLGENFYRQHLHRLILPRITSTDCTVAIMWTSTRDDMVPLNWKPNHFVPVLPIEYNETFETNNVPVSNNEHQKTLCAENNIDIIQIEVITGLDEDDTEQDNDCHNSEIETELMEHVHATKSIDDDRHNGEIETELMEQVHATKSIDDDRHNCEIETELMEQVHETELMEQVYATKSIDEDENLVDIKKIRHNKINVVRDDVKLSNEIEEDSMEPERTCNQCFNEVEKETNVYEETEQMEENCEQNAYDKMETDSISGVELDMEHNKTSFTIDSYLGKHVIVVYDGAPYPGIVRDVSSNDVFVECMKRVGKDANTFIWPKRKDQCWYNLENILAIIPTPSLKENSKSHFEIDSSAWQNAVSKLNSK